MRGDFHMHTTHSDGSLSVEEILEELQKQKVKYFSVTDHDCIAGTIEAVALAPKYGLVGIYGLELSTINNNESIHILGYFSEKENILKIEKFLKHMQEIREKRAKEIQSRLKEYFNIEIDLGKLDSKVTITRYNIASLIIEAGYPYEREEIFENFIGDNCPAYIPSTKISSEEGIKVIKDAGGIAILAHPILYKKNKVEEFLEYGIDGIEVFYPNATDKQISDNLALCKRHNLLVTAGSDFHRFNDYKHGDIGSVSLGKPYLTSFLERLNKWTFLK